MIKVAATREPAVDRIRFSIECGGPEMAPALPQSADIAHSADNPA